MMSDLERMVELTRNLEKNAGATAETLARMEAHFGCALPQQYKEFLLITNGAHGWIEGNYTSLYAGEEVVDVDRIFTSNGQEPMPFFVFATNGGLESYAFDRTQAHLPIINFPNDCWDEIDPYGDTFLEFLELRAADDY